MFAARKPSVLLHGLNELDLVEETPDKTWSKFFPSGKNEMVKLQ
jgi:hypothetical protein